MTLPKTAGTVFGSVVRSVFTVGTINVITIMVVLSQVRFAQFSRRSLSTCQALDSVLDAEDKSITKTGELHLRSFLSIREDGLLGEENDK